MTQGPFQNDVQQPELMYRFNISTYLRDAEAEVDKVHEALIRERGARKAAEIRAGEAEAKLAAMVAKYEPLPKASKK